MSIAPLRGSPVGRPVPLASLVAEVEHALAAIDHGRGGYIWTGAPGAGKSTLLDLVLEAATAPGTGSSHVVAHLHPGVGTPGGVTETLVSQLANLADIPVPAHLARPLARPSTGERPDAACAALVEYARTALPGTTIVLVVDDLDALDPASRSLLLFLVTHHQVSVVLLAAATHATWAEHLPYPMSLRRVPALSPEEVLHLLAARQHPATAPRVATALARQLMGNAACILQTALELTDDQLAGTSLLPNPLPLVPALEAALGPALDHLSEDDRRTLLVAAVSVVDRTDVLLAAAGRTLDDVLDGPVAELVRLAGGRFAVADPALRGLVHGRASVAERTAAHLALAAAHEDAGLADTATWHTALGSLAGDTDLGPRLVDVAERLLDSGDVIHAHEVAREAASQSVGTWTTRAQLAAGVAALRSGHVLDADEWLQQVMRSPDPALTSRALAPYVTAVTLHTGCVPDDDLAQHVERVLADGDVEERARVVAALSTGARLHAERGRLEAAAGYLCRARTMLDRTRDGAAGRGRARDGDVVRGAGGTVVGGVSPTDLAHLTDLVQLDAAWCALFGVETGAEADPCGDSVDPRHGRRAGARLGPGAHPDHQTSARALRALGLVLDDDVETARSSLASAAVAVAPLHDDGTWRDAPGTAVSPLAEALLRTVRVVVELAAADLGAAADELARAAFHVPVDVPLAGIAVALARRVDVFRTDGDGELALALAATGSAPPGAVVRREALVDSVLLSERAGAPCEASAELELLAGPSPAPWDVLLPGLGSGSAPSDGCAGTLTATSLHRARHQLAGARAALSAGDPPAAHEHLVAAAELFGACGAVAWRAEALRESDLATMPVPLPVGLRAALAAPDGPLTSDGPAAPGGPGRSGGPEAPGRPPGPWDAALTPRELDVALLVVQGASNRDVAGALHLSVRTVEVHLGRVFRKLGARSRVELTVLAHRGARRRDARSS